MADEIDRRESPRQVYYFHNGQLLVFSGALFDLTFGELSSMTDDEIIDIIKSRIHNITLDQSRQVNDLESQIRHTRDHLQEFVPELEYDTPIEMVRAIIEASFSSGDLTRSNLLNLLERLSELESELELERAADTFRTTAFLAEPVEFLTSSYSLSVNADGTGNITEYMELTHIGNLLVPTRAGQELVSIHLEEGRINGLRISPFPTFGIVYDATYIGFEAALIFPTGSSSRIFVTRVTNDFPQLVLNSPRSEGVETDVEAAHARLEEELQSRSLPR